MSLTIPVSHPHCVDSPAKWITMINDSHDKWFCMTMTHHCKWLTIVNDSPSWMTHHDTWLTLIGIFIHISELQLERLNASLGTNANVYEIIMTFMISTTQHDALHCGMAVSTTIQLNITTHSSQVLHHNFSNILLLYSMHSFKRKLDLYSAPLWKARLWSAQIWITQFLLCNYTTPAFN